MRRVKTRERAVFKALSNDVRRRLLELLAQREHAVSELALEVRTSPSLTSIHLGGLPRAGLAEARARFERERRLLATLGEGEGFVPLVDSGETADGPYLVMPFLPRGTLRDRLKVGPLTIDEALRLARLLGAALARAHALDIIHR